MKARKITQKKEHLDISSLSKRYQASLPSAGQYNHHVALLAQTRAVSSKSLSLLYQSGQGGDQTLRTAVAE